MRCREPEGSQPQKQRSNKETGARRQPRDMKNLPGSNALLEVLQGYHELRKQYPTGIVRSHFAVFSERQPRLWHSANWHGMPMAGMSPARFARKRLPIEDERSYRGAYCHERPGASAYLRQGCPEVKWDGAFVTYGDKEAIASTTIVFEIESGHQLGWHTDQTEET